MGVSAPEVVVYYNKLIGRVDRRGCLWSSFSLGQQHKLKKYYIKLLLFAIDVALKKSWI